MQQTGSLLSVIVRKRSFYSACIVFFGLLASAYSQSSIDAIEQRVQSVQRDTDRQQASIDRLAHTIQDFEKRVTILESNAEVGYWLVRALLGAAIVQLVGFFKDVFMEVTKRRGSHRRRDEDEEDEGNFE